MAMVMQPVLQLPEPEFDKPFSLSTFLSGRDLDGLSTFPVGDAESEQRVLVEDSSLWA